MPRAFNAFAHRLALSFLALSLSFSAQAKPGFPVFGYLPGYANYGPYGAADGVINLGDTAKFPWDRLTHVMEAFALPTYTGGLTFPYGQRANLVLRAHQNNTRAMLSIGGADLAGLDLMGKFRASTNPTYRAAFIAALTTTAAVNNYDGIDIDWEFPTAGDMNNFTTFMIQLSAALKTQTSNCGGCVFQGQVKQLTFFGSPGADICGVDWDNTTFQNAVDYCIYGGYDFSAPPGYNSPTSTNWLQTDCRGIQYNFCLTQTTKVLTNTVGTDFSWPKSKLVLALPMYDKQSYASFADTPVLVALRQGTFLGMDTPQDEARYNLAGSTHYVNNDTAFCRKMSWALSQGFGGFALWEITHAYPANAPELLSLWNTIGGVAACVNVPTPTPGPTPNLIPSGMVDIGTSGTNTNLWGGNWSTWNGGGGTTVTMNYASPGYAASSYHGTGGYAICGNGNLGTGGVTVSTCLQPACAAYNLDSNLYTRVDFWMNATPGMYRMALDRTTTRGTGNDHYGFDIEVLSSGWRYYSYYLADATQPSWATPDPKAFNDVIGLVFQPVSGFTAYSMCLDDIELVKQVVTPTPTPPAYLLDTIEDGNSTNNWGGGWSTYAPPPSTSTQSFSATGFPFSAYGTGRATRLSGNNSTSALLSTSSTWLSSAQASSSVNLTAYNYLNFYFKGNGVQTQYSVGLERASGENWVFNFTMPATTDWMRIEAPLAQTSWGYSWGGTANSWGLANGRRLYWYSREAGAYDFSVDDIWFENRPPTPTPTVTPSFTASNTRTPSPSPSATPTFTPSYTPTPSASPSSTPTGTPSITLTSTPTASPSVSPSITETYTPVPMGSTATPTPTVSPSWTASPADTATFTPTASPSFTLPPTLSFTPTHTVAPPTATFSLTPSPTPSATVTLSHTPPPVGSTATATPTQSPLQSPTFSHTAVAANSATHTPVAPAATATATPTMVVAAPTATSTSTGGAPTAVPTTAASTGSGTLEILDGTAFPNPSPSSVRLKLDGPADQLCVKVYTVNMQLVEKVELTGAFSSDWVSVPLPPSLRDKLGAGSFFFEADAKRGAVRAKKPLVGTFVFLR